MNNMTSKKRLSVIGLIIRSVVPSYGQDISRLYKEGTAFSVEQPPSTVLVSVQIS